MLLPAPIKFRRHRGRLKKSAAAPVVPGLVLVAASYDAGHAFVELAFDRDIDIAMIDVNQFVVEDEPTTGYLLGGISAEPISPAAVRIMLDRIGNAAQSGVHLTVSPSNGIVAVDDAAAWAGAADLSLPFG